VGLFLQPRSPHGAWGRRRLTRMENYKQKRNDINLLQSRPLEEEYSSIQENSQLGLAGFI